MKLSISAVSRHSKCESQHCSKHLTVHAERCYYPLPNN